MCVCIYVIYIHIWFWVNCLYKNIFINFAETIYDENNHLLPDRMPYSPDKAILKKNHPLMIMVKTGQEDLLAHPLVASLLHHKWSSFGRYVYYLNFFIYCVFFFFFTGYLVTTDAPFHNYMLVFYNNYHI